MSDTKTRLKRMRLADALRVYPKPDTVITPRAGWVRAIRESLGMSQAQLGGRLGISRQSVQDMEKAEAERRITLDSLIVWRGRWGAAWCEVLQRYLDALRAADARDYRPLLAFSRS